MAYGGPIGAAIRSARNAAKAAPRLPAAIALAEAMKGSRRGRYAVAPLERRTVDGVVFASAKEASYYGELRLRECLGEIRALRCHPSWKVEIEGKFYTTYTADFEHIELPGGELVITEVKSTGTRREDAYRLRRKAFELSHCVKVTEVIR